MSWSGQESFQDVRESTGDPPLCPKVVVRPAWMSGSGPEALSEV